MPTITCLCAGIEAIQTCSRFVLLTSRKETTRASNTGRWLKLLNPCRTEVLIWERGQPPQNLLTLIQSDADVRLVYPPDGEADLSQSSVISPDSVFVLLDGTWQEARKMIRRSPYLAALPRLALPLTQRSGYALRANQRGLCTIEAAAACLALAQETDAAQAVMQGFALFQTHFLAGRSGHRPSPG